MIHHNYTISIIGAGSFGTALAIALANQNNVVFLWGRNKIHMDILKKTRYNQKYLPNIKFPPSLFIEYSLQNAISSSRDIIIAIPSHSIRSMLTIIQKYLKPNTRIILTTKGLEEKTGKLMQNVVEEILGTNIPFGIISGPTFAREIAIGLPTAIVLTTTDANFSGDLKLILQKNKNFQVYVQSDFIGIQLAGAIKNVIAIGAGISDGIGFGSNARTALITCGLKEMSHLGVAMGATSNIFTGMAGIGDLILTCTDNQSRNRRFGILLGQGKKICEAKKNIGNVIEGINNTQEIYNLSNKYNIKMPIVNQIYQIIFCNKNIYQAAYSIIKKNNSELT